MKKTLTNVLKKHAHKCMEKTGIWQKHAYKIIFKYMKKTRTQMYGKKISNSRAVGSQLEHPGSMGVQCLAQGHLSCDKEVNCQPSSCQPTNPSFEWWVGIELPTLWLLDDHTHHCATADPNTNIKIYGKNTHTNTHTNVWKKTCIQMYERNRHTHTIIWQKHAYKCMKKTGIQMYDKNTHTNTHTNVWKKQAYKCMKKTTHTSHGCLAQGHLSCDKEVNCHASSCLPTYPFVEQWVGIEPPTLRLFDDHTHHCATANPNTNVKMYEKNRHKNVCKKQAYKYMTKTGIQMYEKNRHTNVWKKTRIQMYEKKKAYKCMTKTRIQTRIQMYEKKQAYKCMKKTGI